MVFQELCSLEMGGAETLTVFISELSFWGCELLKNYGAAAVRCMQMKKKKLEIVLIRISGYGFSFG